MPGYKSYNKPIKIAIAYSLFTIILYEFGPFDFPNYNKFALYFFLAVCNLAMYIGFCVGTKIIPKEYDNVKKVLSLSKFLNILFWVALFTCIPKFMISSGIYNNIISTIIFRISNYAELAQQIYAQRHDLSAVTGVWKPINYGIVLLGPFSWAFLPLSFLYFNKFRGWKKAATIFIWFIYVAQYLCTGTNVGVFTFLITFGIIYIIKKRSTSKRNNLQKVKACFVLLLMAFLFLGMFNTTMGGRKGASYDMEFSSEVCGHRYEVDHNSFLYLATPKSLRPLLLEMTAYISKPYATLPYAFEMPFKSTLGVGYSWFLLDNVPESRYLWERTYPSQLEKSYGYSSWVNWHTAYTWFANDVSWVGVPIILLILFVLFGYSWRRFLDCDDIFSFLLFMLFVRFVLFVSMNNQVFQQSDTFLAFWILIFIRIFSKPYKWNFE